VSHPLPVVRLRRGRSTRLAALRDATDGRSPRLATAVELLDDGEALHVRFRAVDPAAWATHREHDADLWSEEVFELFVAPGRPVPTRYFEIEMNPLGTLFDASVESPHGDRRAMRVDRSWSCDGLLAESRVDREGELWSGSLVVPWRSIGPSQEADWRLNLYRIDRPPDESPEFSAWSPTLVSPADFHRPARFGRLERLG